MQNESLEIVEGVAENNPNHWLTNDGYNFDAIEESVLAGEAGFGNPYSKWTPHEQFLLWKKMIQSGRFQSRDEYCKILVEYSTYEQALQAVGCLCP